MNVEIRVPELGESVTEATVARWLKSVGDSVEMNEELVELETEKVTLEVAAQASGVLTEVSAPQGATVAVGALLGTIGEGASITVKPKAAPAPAAATSAHPPAAAAAAPQTPPLSPAVRKLVADKGLDAAAIAATGKDGRLLKGDVLAAVAGKAPAAAPAPRPAPQARAPEPAPRAPSGPRPEAAREERVRMTRLRTAIARRLKEAQNTAALLSTFNEVDMTALLETRNTYKDAFEKKHGVRLGFMSFFVKASILALREIPAVNAEIDGDDLVYKNYYHVGVAVSAPQGLLVPVVRDADRLTLAGIEKAIGELAAKARDNKLSLDHLTGGTFTITNGGVFGSLLSTPIINPPQSAILGMHKVQKRPVAVGDKVEVRPMMYIALSYDHRVIDGREAVTFLVRVKECLEDPKRLLLEL
ncbi:MAG: 2-oxoglutarate dehydrogenase complex dihydrolipoyllysine-residue succinyltransferase [Alphaproteobacteria bacterium]|nr:2-oxoglutarate dehydrogenase complex dihydrolipoyllysine-residue succinyltransferase [Alphaproteobacteria bacterium]